MPFLGKPMILQVYERVQSLAAEVVVTTNRPVDYEFLGVPLYTDLVKNRGALGGLYTALRVAKQSLVAVVACDMPFANADLLAAARDRLLEANVDAAVPRSEKGFEPFHAVYRRDVCLPAVKKALDAGKWKLISWFQDVEIEILGQEEVSIYDPEQIAFWNMNTLEDLERAEEYVRHRKK